MSEYNPTPVYHPSIRLFDFNEYVEGGPNGLDNLPSKQLADNIEFLLRRVVALEQATPDAPLVPPPAPEPSEPVGTGSGSGSGTIITTPSTQQPVSNAPANAGVWRITAKANTAFTVGSTPQVIMTNPEYANRDIEWIAVLTDESYSHVLTAAMGTGVARTNADGAVMFSLGRIPQLKSSDPNIKWRIVMYWSRIMPTGRIGLSERRWDLGFVQDSSPVPPTNAVE